MLRNAKFRGMRSRFQAAMRTGFNFGHDAQGDVGFRIECAGDLGDAAQFEQRVDINAINSTGNRFAQLFLSLGHAVEDDLIRREANL